MDPRKDYIARLAIDALGASSSAATLWSATAAEMTTNLHGSPAVADFLEQPNVRTLQVSVVPVAGTGAHELAASTTVGLTGQGGAAPVCRWVSNP